MHRFAIGLMTLLVACTETTADQALSACQPLCRCIDAPLPSVQRQCTATCITQFERNPLRDACVVCVIAHADRCTTLIDDCTPACAQAVPLQSYGVPDELGSEDR